MAEDQSEKESAGAAPKKLTSEILSEQDAGDVPKTDESTEKHPAYESDDVGPVGKAAAGAPLKEETATVKLSINFGDRIEGYIDRKSVV